MRMAAGRWKLEVRPERGGRITSLRLDGDELLDQGIGLDQPTADGFVEGGAQGWDEMVPNVEPTEVLPDHGEAWRLPWTVVSSDSSSCVMTSTGRVLPWRLTRRIALGEVVRLDYELANAGSDAIPGYWCAHPLFAYQPGMPVSVDIPRPEEGRSAKVFLAKGSIDRVRVGRVELTWDVSVTPYLAIWVCNGDLGGYRQIAIEPATGGRDRPDSDEPPPQLKPGGSLRWWLEIRPL